MSATLTTWGGKPLPDGWKTFILDAGKVRIQNRRGMIVLEFVFYYDVCEWLYNSPGAWSYHTVSKIFIPPNAAPEYIAWCHEQGIEVHGGEIKRVSVDASGITFSDQTLSDEINPYLHMIITHPETDNLNEEWGYEVREGVTATLTLEMKP